MLGNGLAQRFQGLPVRGTAMPAPVGGSPIGRPMPVWGANPPIMSMPAQGTAMPAPVGMPVRGAPISALQNFNVAAPSGTALPNQMNTLSPQVGNALRRYLGRAY